MTGKQNVRESELLRISRNNNRLAEVSGHSNRRRKEVDRPPVLVSRKKNLQRRKFRIRLRLRLRN
jgi:hypothetical protein